MVDGINVEVRGIRELNRALQKLEFNARRRIISAALRAQGRVVAKAAKSEAPRRSGALKRAIRFTSVRLDRKTGVLSGRVRAKDTKATKKKTRGNRGAFYGHMVAGGTKAHLIPGPVLLNNRWYSNIEHPGAKPNRFFDRAASRSFRAGLSAFRRKFRQRFEIEWKRVYDAPARRPNA